VLLQTSKMMLQDSWHQQQQHRLGVASIAVQEQQQQQ
jgi:hypothetical protein